MPEGLEVEIWRRASTTVVGRRIAAVRVDPRALGAPDDPRATLDFVDALAGARITSVGRIGKVLTFGIDSGHVVGVHFGMTGRLVVDGHAAIDRLAYASGRDEAAWDRLVVWTGRARSSAPGAAAAPPRPALRVNDPRRFGHVALDPDLSLLGIDLFDLAASRAGELSATFARRRTAVKNVLLDQHVIAGLGNLLVDELLWWTGIDPHRPADEVEPRELRALLTTARRRLPMMLARGGSTEGTLTPAVRAACPPCPRDGHPLHRGTVGQRTTVWCPAHQR